MNEAAIKQKISELVNVITSSPFLGQVLKAVPQGAKQPGAAKDTGSIESSLDQFRIQVKYLLFDLEATRRENRYLRQMLEARHKRDLDDPMGEGPPMP